MATDAPALKTLLPGYRFGLVGWLSFGVVLFWGVVAVLAPYITPHSVGDIVDMDFFGPLSREFPLGTDYLGRDMLSRILFGARYTVGISLAATGIS